MLEKEGYIMAIVKTYIDFSKPIPQEVIDDVEEASKFPITYDEDCPEMTDEELVKFAEIVQRQKAERVKKVVSLRISPATLEKAQKFGKGYTGVLSRILENALNDPELLRKCL